MSKVNIANSTQVFYETDQTTDPIPAAKRIRRIVSISGPNRTSEDIDITAFDSPGSEREYLSGRVDPGEISIEIQYSRAEATHAWLEDQNASQSFGVPVTQNFCIRFLDDSTPGAQQYTTKCFKATVSGFEFSGDIDSAKTATVTLRVTGSTVITFPDSRTVA